MMEQILSDACQANKAFAVSVLRCFNPCGAHRSGRIGGVQSECMLCAQQSCNQDCVHVEDVAYGHALALKKLFKNGSGITVHNLVSVANSQKARAELGWQAKCGLGEIVASARKWHLQNPFGYSSGQA